MPDYSETDLMTLTNGVHHIALLTRDLDRLAAFYAETFDAVVDFDLDDGGMRHALIDMGGGVYLHPFELADNPHATGDPEMFARGHIDHFALMVPDDDTFELLRRRLVERCASDGTLTDFGPVRSVMFEDPDGHHCEIAITVDAPPLTEWRREPYRPGTNLFA
jgi:catechol 2,3-dioxygenase-like lactoylglutathione lyase family enzyme